MGMTLSQQTQQKISPMSGTPKYSTAELNEARQRALEAARRRQAREEEHTRRQVEKQEWERRQTLWRQQKLSRGEGQSAPAPGRIEAEMAVAALGSLCVAMQQDALLMRWLPREVLDLEIMLRDAEQAVVENRFALPPHLLEQARRSEQRLVAQANAAQLKADKRDHVARSMAIVLQAMGFVTTQAGEEHPGHPATALLLRAEKASGENVLASVPLEGDVWYEMPGYPHTVEQNGTTGEHFATCAAAETLLNAMRSRLSATFGVDLGEIQWAEKTPHHVESHEQALPASHPAPFGKNRS
ncbi:MAG: hypothetical protein HQL63_14800 [Magnetococcales bacterium]|nr:hypothetical protein [Magnetococcales bacterium]